MTYIFQPDRHLLIEQIKKYSNYISGKTLDVGAGHYSRYEKFFKTTEYIRMDINHADNVDLVGSIEDIPLKDESVDSIVCTQVLEHIKYPDKAATQMFRVLKKGGCLLFTVPQMNELHEEPHDYFRYTKYGLERIFKDVGFDVVVMESRGGFFATLGQLVIRFTVDFWKLYDRKLLAKFFSKIILLEGKLLLFLDRKFSSNVASSKHTIGWCCVFKKPL